MKLPKQLHPGALIGIIVGAVLVVGLAGWFLLVRPQGAKLKSLKRETADTAIARLHDELMADEIKVDLEGPCAVRDR